MRHCTISIPTLLPTWLMCASALMLCACSDVSVGPPTLTAISIGPPDAALAKGSTSHLLATGIYSDGTRRALVSMVTWSTANPAVASISNAAATAGLLTAVDVGSTTVNASYDSVSGTTSLTVTAATLASMSVTPGDTLPAGLTQQFMASGTYTDGSIHDLTTLATWSSTAARVATISNAPGSIGIASTLVPGSTTISANVGSKSAATSLNVGTAVLMSIGVSPPSPSLAVGFNFQVVATGIYSDHSTHRVNATAKWTSSAPTVATLSNATGFNGMATAISPGSTIVTATIGGISGSDTLTVTAFTLVSIGVTPAAQTIAIGADRQFTATGTLSDNSVENLTTAVIWNSSAPAVAAISNASGSNGLATARSAGTTTVTASFGGITGSAAFTVSATRLVSIAVTPVNPRIGLSTQQQLTATGTFSDHSTQDLTSDVIWDCADTLVAVVLNEPGFNGLAVAQSTGSTTVTASLNGLSGSTGLTVLPATLQSIVVTPAHSRIANGTQQEFTATGHYTDRSTQDITSSVIWASSAPSIAPIGNAAGSVGIATASAVGSTTIEATSHGITGRATLSVTAATLASIAVTPPDPTVATGYPQWFVATGTYTDGSTRNLTSAVAWNSSAQSIASISNAAGYSGLATANQGVGFTHIGAVLGGIHSPTVMLTVIAAQEYAYVADVENGTVSQYTIGSGGALTAPNPPTVGAGVGPSSIALDPTYRYAYVANDDGTVSQYTIGATGGLTPMTVATVAVGQTPQAIAVDPTGRFVYVANSGDGTVSQLTIGSGGALTAMHPVSVTTGGAPEAVAIDASGRYLYVADGVDSVAQFTIGSGGALTAMNPASVVAGSLPQALAVDPSGRYVYVANGFDNSIAQFSMGAAGTLTALNPPTVATGTYPTSVAVDPSGRYVYVAANTDGTLWQYGIGTDGSLSVIDAGNAQAGGSPQFVIVDSSDSYVYASVAEDAVAGFVIGAGGTLPNAGSTSTPSNGAGAVAIGY
jgi:6-phosphogluconolactonase (cycloisomerase 2 family)